MTNSTTECNGGLIRFIPFSGNDWIGQFLLESFEHRQIQILIIVLVVNLFLFLFINLRLCYKRYKQPSQIDRTSIQSGNSRSQTSLELHYFKTQDCDEWIQDLWHPEMENSRKTRWKQIDNQFDDLSNIYMPNERQRVPSLETSALVKIYRRRITILSIVSALFVICLVGHVASLIIAIRSEQSLVNNLNDLPIQTHVISQNGIGFVHYAMDIVLNISKAHILNDAHRLDNGSYLQGFVREIKILVSQVIACLAYDCYNLSNRRTTNMTLLPLENTSQSDLDTHQLISEQLLQSFELAIKRFENLNNAAQKLNPNTIQQIQHAWYEYRQDLSTLVPNNPILTSSESQKTWASYDLMRQTRDLICAYLDQSRLDQFETCDQVENYLNQVIQYANRLPYMMPSKRLDSVTSFTLIPRALNVEQLVNQWMPVLYDLPGKGLVLLLDTFLKPEMSKGESKLQQISNSFPPPEIANQIATYTRYLNSALIITFVVCMTLTVTICSTYLLVFVRHWKIVNKCRKFLSNWNRFDHAVADFHQIINKSTGCTSICSLLGLIFFTILTMTLLALSLGLVYASILTRIEGCDTLMGQSSCINENDQILTKRIELTASLIPQLGPFLAIDQLNIQYPKHILAMLNNPYENGQKSLLAQIQMTKPVNFTALLEAQWTLDQISKAWDKDVIAKLSQEDLKSKIPQINLTQIYDQTVKTLHLAKSFDDLQVGHVTDYLNDPGPNWFAKLGLCLRQIQKQEAQKLADFYDQLNRRYLNYSNLYEHTTDTLEQIDANKALLQVINVLVQTGSRILQALYGQTNQDLIELIDQFLPVIFPKLKPLGEQYLIPFVENLLIDMIPYEGLNQIYVQTLQIACPIKPEYDSTLNKQSLIENVQTMAISMSALCVTLLLLCLICSILF